MNDPRVEAPWQTKAPSAIPFCGRLARAAAMHGGRHRGAAGDVRRSDQARRPHWLRPDRSACARTAICCTSSCRRISNKRTDQYGGSLENRMRAAARHVQGDARGLAGEQAARHAHFGGRLGRWRPGASRIGRSWRSELKASAATSSTSRPAASISRSRRRWRRAIQVPFATAIKEKAGIADMAVGMITEAEQAEAIVAEGRADMWRSPVVSWTIRIGAGMPPINLVPVPKLSIRRSMPASASRPGTPPASATAPRRDSRKRSVN